MLKIQNIYGVVPQLDSNAQNTTWNDFGTGNARWSQSMLSNTIRPPKSCLEVGAECMA